MKHDARQTVCAARVVRRAGALAALAGACSVLALMGCSRSGTTGTPGAMTADRAVVKKASFDITTTASGELEAKNQIEIRSQLETQANIVKIVDEGVTVKKGDVLIELNSDKIDGQLLDAQIALDGAKAELMTAQNNHKIQETDNQTKVRQAELKVELAQIALEQWQEGEVKKKQQEIQLAIEKAGRDLKRLEEKYTHSKELFEKKYLSKNDFELDEIALIEAQAAVAKAALDKTIYEEYTHRKELKKNQSDVDDAQAELARTKLNAESELANKAAALRKADDQLKRRDEQLVKLQKQKAACTIIAPSDGLVVYGTSLERSRWGWGGDGPLQVGKEVYPNMLLMVLPDTSEMVASVKVQENLAAKIKPGLVASVRVDAAGGRSFTGKVDTIGVLAESAGWRDPNMREYTVKISLSDVGEGAGLKPSMRCESQLVLGRVDEATSVPVQAVFNDGAVRFVYASEGAQFLRLPVKLGRRSETTAEIEAGVAPDRVVLLREPSPGEILSRPWEKESLALAGYGVGQDGVPFILGAPGQNANSGLKPNTAAPTPAPGSEVSKPALASGEGPKTEAGETVAVKVEAKSEAPAAAPTPKAEGTKEESPGAKSGEAVDRK